MSEANENPMYFDPVMTARECKIIFDSIVNQMSKEKDPKKYEEFRNILVKLVKYTI